MCGSAEKSKASRTLKEDFLTLNGLAVPGLALAFSSYSSCPGTPIRVGPSKSEGDTLLGKTVRAEKKPSAHYQQEILFLNPRDQNK